MNLRVHLLYESDRFGNPHGSGHIRLLRPLSHPALGEGLSVTSGLDLPDHEVDVVLVERGWRADATLQTAAALVSAIRERGYKLLYTLDDNLLDLHRGLPWHEFSTDRKRNIVRYFLRHADGVIVSTKTLKQRLRYLNTNIHVVENALDERLFLSEHFLEDLPQASQSGGKLVIGYMGTHSHLRDLMMVLEPLRAVLRQAMEKVTFQIVGISADARVLKCFDGLPFQALDTGGNHFYPDFVPWAKKNLRWDVAIAPLEDNVFTRCKSDIKYLDYALLGAPGIYSNMEAYCHTVRHGENGLLCNDDPQAWREALEKLLYDSELRQRVRQNACTHVIHGRTLEHCAVNWKNAIIAATEQKQGRPGSLLK